MTEKSYKIDKRNMSAIQCYLSHSLSVTLGGQQDFHPKFFYL